MRYGFNAVTGLKPTPDDQYPSPYTTIQPFLPNNYPIHQHMNPPRPRTLALRHDQTQMHPQIIPTRLLRLVQEE